MHGVKHARTPPSASDCRQLVRPFTRPVVREGLVYAVPNKGNADLLLNGDDMAASVVLFERGEVRRCRPVRKRRGEKRRGEEGRKKGTAMRGFYQLLSYALSSKMFRER